MNRTEFLLTKSGATSRHWSNYIKHHVSYSFDGNPHSKNSMKLSNKLAFQSELLKQMKEKGKRGFHRGTKICIEMNIFSNSKNPPHIHKIPKNYLDLISKPLKELHTKRKYLLFEDDMQVANLFIQYNFLNENNPRIEIIVYPFKLLINDFRLSNALINEELNDTLDYENIFDVHDEYLTNDFSKDMGKLFELRSEMNTSDYRTKKYKYANTEEIIKLDKMNEELLLKSLQLNFLKSQHYKIDQLYRFLCNSITYSDTILNHLHYESIRSYDLFFKLQKEMNELLRKETWILTLVKMQAPNVPTEDGEKSHFIEGIKKNMQLYYKKNWFLAPLYTPVTLNVLYKPPLTKKEFHKDLDNIMRIVVPIFHETFKPPVSIYQKKDEEDINDLYDNENYALKLKNQYSEELNKIPTGMKSQILGYEIIEIPREINDNSEGFLIIGISEAWSRSIVSKTHEIITS